MDRDGSDLQWLDARNQSWARQKGKHAAHYINFAEGRIYFYERNEDAPDNPVVWYPGETIGTWSPRGKTFAWACDNITTRDPSISASMKVKTWLESKGMRSTGALRVETLQEAWVLVATAARLSDVIAVYRSEVSYRDVKDELATIGKRVPVRKGATYNHVFFAITGDARVTSRASQGIGDRS